MRTVSGPFSFIRLAKLACLLSSLLILSSPALANGVSDGISDGFAVVGDIPVLGSVVFTTALPIVSSESSSACTKDGCKYKKAGYRPEFQEAMGVLAALNAGKDAPVISSPLRAAIVEERTKLAPTASDVEVIEHLLAEKSAAASEAK